MTDLGRLVYLFKLITNRTQAQADATFKKYNLTWSQVRVLDYLLLHDREATQKEIEDFLSVSHPNAVGLVSRLQKRDFVTTRTASNDRRNKIVRITPKAEEALESMSADRIMLRNRLIRHLSESDIVSLERMLEIIWHNFE